MAVVNGVPQGQMAYQSTWQTKYQASIEVYAQTMNRYFGGSISQSPWTAAGMIGGPVSAPTRVGRRMGFTPIGGNAVAVQVSGGANYAPNDTVTFQAVNGGRPIKVKVLTVSGGAPTGLQLLDPGSGLVAGGDGKNNYNTSPPTPTALTQASTSGTGSGATWTANGAFGLVVDQQPLPTA